MRYLPLIATSLLFNAGTLTLSILLMGWYSVIVIGLIFLANIFMVTMLSSAKVLQKYQLVLYISDLGSEEKKKPTILDKLWLSYSNIFIISRLVEARTCLRINNMYLLQPLYFLINLLPLVVFLCLGSEFFYPEFQCFDLNVYGNYERDTSCPVLFENYSLIIITILFMGVLNTFFCFAKCGFNIYVGEVSDNN